MPYSSPFAKQEIANHFNDFVPKETKIIDVGPGCGTYWYLLSNLGYKLDCLEIWEPYISTFELNHKYNKVHLGNIIDFNIDDYEYIILGDVLEHLHLSDAQNLINKINKNHQKCLVAVPYLWEQGECENNIYETHLQPDLTPENMLEKYPSLHFLYGNEGYGYYINYTI
jgi:hypothetical protein